VQTLERAADLLRGAGSLDRVADIFRELGFSDRPLALDERSIAALGLPADLRGARITQGRGALRGLALQLDKRVERDTLVHVANALARNASQLLWLVVAINDSTADAAILCWRSAVDRARVASLIWQRNRVAQSDAETLCSLAAVGGESDLFTHARWLDVLGREAITNRFFRTLERTVEELSSSLSGKIERDERRELSLLYLSRLIFLSFLQTKGWLNGDFSFLANGYTRCIQAGGRYQKRVLEPLFFGTLNARMHSRSPRAREFGRIPFLNGGLFSRSHLEKRRRASVFSDESFGNAFGALLSHYRFSGREDSVDWSEASIDPEILGKAFEALMGSVDRKKSGAFYTPQDLVEALTSHALSSSLHGPSDPELSLDAIRALKVLDPACGSGAFLVHTLERLASLRRLHGETGSIAEIRRRVLTTSIFGVDLNPMAVWLCELRLWLSIVIESKETDPMRIAPLPNLDRHIRIGDSLAGGAFDDSNSVVGSRKLEVLRTRYVRATGRRKLNLARSLDWAERAAATEVLVRRRVRLTSERRELLISARRRDLFGGRHQPDQQTRLRLAGTRRGLRDVADKMRALHKGGALPFSFGAHFSDIAAAGGFDLVVGNPPWVRVHRIAEVSRQRLRHEFVVYRRAAWETGAVRAGAGRGFAGQIDLAALFVERACDLLRPGGTLAYLLPTKLWRSLAGGGVRELLMDCTDIVHLEDLTDSHSLFDAAVYPSLLVARRRAPSGALAPTPEPTSRTATAHEVNITIRSGLAASSWRCPVHRLSLDKTAGSPWLLLPAAVRTAFDCVTRSATSFSASRFGRPLLGVKTGCNDAYLVRVLDRPNTSVAHIGAGDRVGEIETELLRPVIRGETLDHWQLVGAKEYLVWPHCPDGTPRRELPPLARRWLSPYRDALIRRTDLHGSTRWWSVFRTESARFESPRVIWADFGLRPRAMVVDAGDRLVALNTCYVVACESVADAHALAAILNSQLAAAWLGAIAEPARGGYHRYLGWTMSMLPIPGEWDRARQILSPLGEQAMLGAIPADTELLDAVLNAYQLDRTVVQPLLSWGISCV
jgi:hypothetical protein